MTDPIISPWVFYLADMCDTLNFVLFILAVIIFSSSIIDFIDDRKIHKKSFIVFFILLTLAVVVPRRQTVYKMLVAHYTTEQNINMLDKIVDTAKRIQGVKR